MTYRKMIRSMPMRKIHLIANNKSGQGQGESLAERATRICKELEVEFVCYSIHTPEDLNSQSQIAVDAAKNTMDVVIAAGGDGTIRTVAEQAVGQPVVLAIVPCGTFNFFARTHQIPEDHEAALRLAITGKPQPVRLGAINGRTFLINASLGLYAKSIAEREQNTNRFGRMRLVVIISTIVTLLKKHRLLDVTMKSDGLDQVIKTPMVFIGNNALQLRDLALPVAKCFEKNMLAVVTLKPVRGWEMVRVIFRGILKTMQNEERLNQMCTDLITISTKRKKQRIALDGEIFEMNSPFHIESIPNAIRMIKPQPADLKKSLDQKTT